MLPWLVWLPYHGIRSCNRRLLCNVIVSEGVSFTLQEVEPVFIDRLYIKIPLIVLITLALMVGFTFVKSVVSERQQRQQEAIADVSATWGESQKIAGPILRIPYRIAKDTNVWSFIVVLPDRLDMNVDVRPEVRYRGIFRVVLYDLDLGIRGAFKRPDLAALGIDSANVDWGHAVIEHGITDARGVAGQIVLTWNDERYDMVPGVTAPLLGGKGIRTTLDLDPSAAVLGTFALGFGLHGTDNVMMAPLGTATTVSMRSTWPHPSFEGAWLPTHRITNEGFDATWKVSYYGRQYPSAWNGRDADYKDAVQKSYFGLRLVESVDVYHQVERSVKYVLLVILLTFVFIFVLEVVSKLRVHPMQYLLVGMALVIFYLLLLALSEHLTFSVSYVAATIAITALVGGYMTVTTRSVRRGILTASILAGLYGFIFVLLQLETYSLLCGSIGIFLALAALMYSTRNVDWYGYGSGVDVDDA